MSLLRLSLTVVLAVVLCCAAAFAKVKININEKTGNEKTGALAQQAVSDDHAKAARAAAELRAMGADGLDALFEFYAEEIAAYSSGGAVEPAKWERIAYALDLVSMQKDSYAAKLFWHTDFAKAQEIAKRENKPILSLRLLGNLNEELSCANSRFFRALLYSNANISQTLREKFVLHWQTVRPAPKVTIDFGDGRKIERTLTGNSIHYITDENGNLLDALPGLYSPTRFSGWLIETDKNFQTWRKTPRQQTSSLVRFWHRQQFGSLSYMWRAELEKAKAEISLETGKPPTALEAGRLTMTKIETEESVLKRITTGIETLKENTDLNEWKKMAAFAREKVEFDQNTRNFIRRQLKETTADSPRLKVLLENLRTAVALDSLRNECLMRSKLHEWFARGEAVDFKAFNDRVYAELFKTPNSDLWLGLYQPEIYSALDDDGMK